MKVQHKWKKSAGANDAAVCEKCGLRRKKIFRKKRFSKISKEKIGVFTFRRPGEGKWGEVMPVCGHPVALQKEESANFDIVSDGCGYSQAVFRSCAPEKAAAEGERIAGEALGEISESLRDVELKDLESTLGGPRLKSDGDPQTGDAGTVARVEDLRFEEPTCAGCAHSILAHGSAETVWKCETCPCATWEDRS